MDTDRPICVRHWLIRLVSAWLALTIATSAQSAGIFQGSLNAVLGVADLSGGNLQLFNFVIDDGADANTTFASVSPPSSPGSSASAAAAVDLSAVANNTLGFSASAAGLAAGAAPGVPVSAVSNAQSGGGFFLANQTANSIDVRVTFTWNWSASVLADDDINDFALFGVTLDYFEDGLLVSSLVSMAMGTPPNSASSDSTLSGGFLTIAPFSERNVALIASVSGLAESVQAAAVPEPQLASLLGLGFVSLLLVSHRLLRHRSRSKELALGKHQRPVYESCQRRVTGLYRSFD